MEMIEVHYTIEELEQLGESESFTGPIDGWHAIACGQWWRLTESFKNGDPETIGKTRINDLMYSAERVDYCDFVVIFNTGPYVEYSTETNEVRINWTGKTATFTPCLEFRAAVDRACLFMIYKDLRSYYTP
jgi:hypothetical protein